MLDFDIHDNPYTEEDFQKWVENNNQLFEEQKEKKMPILLKVMILQIIVLPLVWFFFNTNTYSIIGSTEVIYGHLSHITTITILFVAVHEMIFFNNIYGGIKYYQAFNDSYMPYYAVTTLIVIFTDLIFTLLSGLPVVGVTTAIVVCIAVNLFGLPLVKARRYLIQSYRLTMNASEMDCSKALQYTPLPEVAAYRDQVVNQGRLFTKAEIELIIGYGAPRLALFERQELCKKLYKLTSE
jgi:hypothetical protein